MEIRNRVPSRTPRQDTPPTNLPTQGRKFRLKKIISYVFVVLLFLYLIPPFALRYSSWLRDAFIFVHHVKTPFFGNISDPSSFGVNSARQFELFHENGCRIEIWQILPKDYHEADQEMSQISNTESEYISALSDGSPVILYLHGNTGTRAQYHRVQLYKYLSEEIGFHVITFDYRGYGNSKCYPSERAMMEDGKLVWRWLREKAPGAKIYIWGHSLGSAAGTYLVKDLCSVKDFPSGLILDAPFTDMAEEIEHHPFSFPYRPFMSLFVSFILEHAVDKFESVDRMQHIMCPILILHGRLDYVVPFHLGEKLYRAAVKSREGDRSLGEVEFVDCESSGHRDNWKSQNAQKALKRFTKT